MPSDQIPLESSSLKALWDFQDPAESERRFVEFGQRSRIEGHEYLAQLAATQQARALGLQRKFEEAQQLLDSIPASPSEIDGELETRIALERGRLMNSSGDREGSVPEFKIAWNVSCDKGLDGLAVDAAHMLGIVLDGEDGMGWNTRALELAMSSEQPDARKWRGSLLNNMGWSFHEVGQYGQALDHFESALAARIEEGNETTIRVARWCIGRCLRSLKRLDEAIEIQQTLASDPEADGYVYEELGECMLAQDRSAEARPNFAKAHAMLSKDIWLSANESDRLDRLKKLAEEEQ
jgi:tetratricopeptide (TPR) repeat protein